MRQLEWRVHMHKLLASIVKYNVIRRTWWIA